MLHILVTGATSGIGLALSKILVTDHKAKVYLCARNPAKGEQAIQDVKEHYRKNTATATETDDVPVELVIMEVGDDESVQAAAKQLKDVRLDVIVNNAGIGLTDNLTPTQLVNVNTRGPKRVVDNLAPLLNPNARIVNVGSGAGPMFVAKQTPEKQKRMCDPDITWQDIEQLESEGAGNDSYRGYGLSKALLACYTVQLSKQYDPSKVAVFCVTPGFVDTNMTKGYGAKLSPAQGTIPIQHCIFKATPEQSGWYFGSDSLHSPLHKLRSPGETVFDGVYPWEK